MATTHGILIALSSKRLALLESEPDTLEDVVEARHEDAIPGLLDLKTYWETLDMIMSGRGRDEILGDVLLARSGKNLSVDNAFESARVLSPQRVAEIAAKLSELTLATFKERAQQLGKAKDMDQLLALYKQIVALYDGAAKSKQSMLALLV
jgi:hypothetical protein